MHNLHVSHDVFTTGSDGDNVVKVGVVWGQLLYHPTGRIQSVDPESCCLTQNAPLRVLIPVRAFGGRRRPPGNLGADKEAVGAVAYPRDSHGRVKTGLFPK